MSEIQQNEEIKQECFCKKRAKDILTIAIGSFVGVYCALSLFAALHKPSHFVMRPQFRGHHEMIQKQMPDFKRPPMPGKFKNPQFDEQFKQNDKPENVE